MAMVLLILCGAGSSDPVRSRGNDAMTDVISGIVDTSEESESLELEDDDALVDHKLDNSHLVSACSFMPSDFFAGNQVLGEIVLPPPQG